MARERKEPKKISGARKRGDWWHFDKKIDGVRYREPLNTKDWRVSAIWSARALLRSRPERSPHPLARCLRD